MASDASYAAFLAKANQNPSENYGQVSAAQKSKATIASEVFTNAPSTLVTAVRGTYYTSDSDEPFAAVSIPSTQATLPDEDTFVGTAYTSAPGAEVSILDPYEWDRNGRYTELLKAVREAGHGNDVRVYRVQLDSTRVEYWMVTVAENEGTGAAKATSTDARLVGVKVLAVES